MYDVIHAGHQPRTRTREVDNRGASEFGGGWMLDGADKLVERTDHVTLFQETG